MGKTIRDEYFGEYIKARRAAEAALLFCKEMNVQSWDGDTKHVVFLKGDNGIVTLIVPLDQSELSISIKPIPSLIYRIKPKEDTRYIIGGKKANEFGLYDVSCNWKSCSMFGLVKELDAEGGSVLTARILDYLASLLASWLLYRECRHLGFTKGEL